MEKTKKTLDYNARAKKKYDEKTARYFSLKLNINTDLALIKKLDEQETVQGYIKNLIRADIAASNAATQEE